MSLAQETEPREARAVNSTRLVFVGEDLEVLSIASKHPERPENAPAIAQVLLRENLREQGIFTAGEALSTRPGFHMLPREWGTEPYLRGLSNSFLFLYDGVPLTTDSTKNIFPLDRELSLDLLQRLEVVRGPGSVLWGPDAFAGVVNVVPLSGKDAPGLWVQGTGTTEAGGGATIRYGKDGGRWDWFIGANVYQSEYWDPEFEVERLIGDDNFVLPFEDRFGDGEVPRDHYVEITSNFRYGDWLRLSGRFSDYDRHFTLEDPQQNLKWSGKRSTPLSLIKLELNKQLEGASVRLNSYYSRFELENSEIDLDRSHQNDVANAELLYDQELWERRALMTLGASYRYNRASNVAIDQGYVPSFVSPENLFFVPRVIIEDYDTDLLSFFGQFRLHTDWFDAWAGARYDDHSQYQSTISLSGGLTKKWSHHSTFKLLFGTAFRTPFAQQLFETIFTEPILEDDEIDPEQIRSVNLQWLWEPSRQWKFSTTAFYNRLHDHLSEDPFGILSTPTSQDIYGLELEGKWKPSRALSLWANASFLHNEGDDQIFRVVTFFEFDENLEPIPVIEEFTQPFEVGPDALVNAGVTWEPTDKWTFAGRFSYYGRQKFVVLPDPTVLESDEIWLMNLSGTWHWKPKLDLGLAVKNALSSDPKIPGTYGLDDYPPTQAWFWLKYDF